MKEYEKRRTGLLNSTGELRKLLLEHPELPLLVLAGEECNGGDYSWMACSSVKAQIGEFLDCDQTVDDEYCFIDREEFEEAIENNSDFTGTDAEFTEYIKARMAEYEPHWKPCIILYVDN